MHLKVPFRLRRLAGPAPADALLACTCEAGEILKLCALARGRQLPKIYPVTKGLVIVLPEPNGHRFPGVVRLRRLRGNIFLPVDAYLIPALLGDEERALAWQRGLVFLPGGCSLEFDPGRPVALRSLLSVSPLQRRSWQPPPAARDFPPLREVAVALPFESTPDEVLDDESTEDIGSEEPRPEASGPAAGLAGKAGMLFGKALVGLGKMLHWRGLAALGARLIQSAVSHVPRLGEKLLGLQEAALRELLREFREGNTERALRRALPLGEASSRGVGTAGGARLPWQNIKYSLPKLLADYGKGQAGYWLGGYDVQRELAQEYRKAAEEAVHRGDYRRAAYIYGRLLRDYRQAANTLFQGGLHRDAAILYLKKVGDSLAAGRAFEAAGELDRALEIYRRQNEHVKAGDLLRRMGEEEAAIAAYLLAADRFAQSKGGYLAAGELLLSKAGRMDLAIKYLRSGWASRPAANATACALRLAGLFVESEWAGEFSELLADGEECFRVPGNDQEAAFFFNGMAKLADSKPLAARRDDIRDRCLLAIARKIQQRTEWEARPGDINSLMLGQSGVWAAPLINDAQFALSRILKHEERPVPQARPQQANPIRVGNATVTAAVFARETGDVFIGCANGEIYCFRPQTTEVVRVAVHGSVIEDLAVDRKGQLVVSLRIVGQIMQIASYEKTDDGAYESREDRALSEGGPFWLAPQVANYPTSDRCFATCLANQRLLLLFDGPSLAIGSNLSSDRCEELVAGLLVPLPERYPSKALGILAFNGDMLVAVSKNRGRFCETSVGWQPQLPLRSSLKSVPLSWLHSIPLELAGLKEDGSLHWTCIRLAIDKIECLKTNSAAPDGGYLAATIIRSGRLAAVRRSSIHWLRAGPKTFSPWAITRVSIPQAVACFPSRLTNELVVVCRDGSVVRVSIPN
jgi:tetratricopeptide (TPR) repeat protein